LKDSDDEGSTEEAHCTTSSNYSKTRRTSSKNEVLILFYDLDDLPTIDHLLENPVDRWYEQHNFNNEPVALHEETIKLQRKHIGVKVSVRSTTTADTSGTISVSKKETANNIAFSWDQCPPPLPKAFFQILEQTQNRTKNDKQDLPNMTKQKSTTTMSRLFHQVHKQLKLQQPTPIQLQTWPIFLAGGNKNSLVVAPTGSGKTFCYSIPIVHFCIRAILQGSFRAEEGPLALVISPTRELANQIGQSFKKVAKCANTILHQEYLLSSSLKKNTRIAPKVKIMSIYGGDGMSKQEQLDCFQPGESTVHVVTATPGRLLDLLGVDANKNGRSSLSLKNVSWLVIDEADRMLAIGFREQIDEISLRIRKDRMTSLFTATFPDRLAEACNQWCTSRNTSLEGNIIVVKASTIQIGSTQGNEEKAKSDATPSPMHTRASQRADENTTKSSSTVGELLGNSNSDLLSRHDEKVSSTAELEEETGGADAHSSSRVTEISLIPSHIAQILHVCAAHKKPKKLLGILHKLREAERGRRQQGLLVIFFAKIKTLQFISKLLKKETDAKCAELHGQLKQSERERTLNHFKSGKITVLLSTDVAARGIHVNNIEYIVNYDFPSSIEQYVHRCGRAARSYGNSKKDEVLLPSNQPAACIYSFFTRDFAPMAKDMLQLLRATNAWIDPNLIELANESDKDFVQKKCEAECKKDIVKKRSKESMSAEKSEKRDSNYE